MRRQATTRPSYHGIAPLWSSRSAESHPHVVNDSRLRTSPSPFQWGTREVSLSLQYTFGANSQKRRE